MPFKDEYANNFEELLRLFSGNLSFGVPIGSDGASETGPVAGHIRGAWVEKTLTAATGSTTFTHGLNIPVIAVTGAGDTANRLNVRWFLVGAEYGDRTGTNAAPAAPGGFSVNLLKMSDATVTPDEVDLRYAVNGFIPSATNPLYLSLYFIPAVR
jgi:hypothetical protein